MHDYRRARQKRNDNVVRRDRQFHRQFRKPFRHEVSIRKSPPLVPNVRKSEKYASICIAGNGNVCRESAATPEGRS